MKPLIEPPAFLEAYKYANPLPPKINLLPIKTPPPAGNKNTGIYFWIILGVLCIVGGKLVIDHLNKKDKTNLS